MEDIEDEMEMEWKESKEVEEEIENMNGIWKRPLILIDLKLMKERYENVKIEMDDDDNESNSNKRTKVVRKTIRILEPINISGMKRKEEEEADKEKDENKKIKNDGNDENNNNNNNDDDVEKETIESFVMIENKFEDYEKCMNEFVVKKEKDVKFRGELNFLQESDVTFIFGYVESSNSMFLELFFPTSNAMKYLNCVQITSAYVRYEDEFDEQEEWVQKSVNDGCTLIAISSIPFNDKTRKFRKYWKGIPDEFSKDDHEFNISFANIPENKVIEYKKSISHIPSISVFATFSITTTFTC